jgi:uncharacterized protein
MMELAGMQYLAVFLLGLFSAPHCAGMCGGIASALLYGSARQRSPEISVLRMVQVDSAGSPAGSLAGSLAGSVAGSAAGSAAGHSAPSAPVSGIVGHPNHALGRALYFGLGKMLAYVLLGVIAGSIGFAFGALGSAAAVVLRSMAGMLMIAMGLYSAGWWLGLHRLEAVAYRFWQPALRALGSFTAGSTANKIIVGVIFMNPGRLLRRRR